MPLIDSYGKILNPDDDIQFRHASEIIMNSKTKMELVENAYIFGLFSEKRRNFQNNHVPVFDIPMMSDERWNELASKCKRMGVLQ